MRKNEIIGISILIVGSIIFVIGLVYGFWMIWHCPANGCGDIIDKQINYPIRYPLMTLGIIMIAIGIWIKTRSSTN